MPKMTMTLDDEMHRILTAAAAEQQMLNTDYVRELIRGVKEPVRQRGMTRRTRYLDGTSITHTDGEWEMLWRIVREDVAQADAYSERINRDLEVWAAAHAKPPTQIERWEAEEEQHRKEWQTYVLQPMLDNPDPRRVIPADALLRFLLECWRDAWAFCDPDDDTDNGSYEIAVEGVAERLMEWAFQRIEIREEQR